MQLLYYLYELYKTNENNKSSITPILKLFSIINISVLSAISIIITTNGIIAFIPLIIFSIAFLKSAYLFRQSIGIYPYAIFMFIGFCKLFMPKAPTDFYYLLLLLL